MDARKKVSIGIPVYNEIQFINNTLHSAVQQDAEQIVISDNASTDGTSEICQEYAAKYNNITYYRFDTTHTIEENSINCLNLAEHDYYMVMGGHDLLSKNYVSALRTALDSSDAVGAYTNAVHLSHEYAFKHSYTYSFSSLLEHESAKVRALAAIEFLANCTLIYGLLKKDIFRNAYNECKKYQYVSFDHGLLTQIAIYGKMKLCPEATFFRIDPPRDEPSMFEKWKRMQQAQYGASYDERKHIPELIPFGIAYVQFQQAKTLITNHNEEREYLLKVMNILFDRWGVNNTSVAMMHKGFQKLAAEIGISLNIRK